MQAHPENRCPPAWRHAFALIPLILAFALLGSCGADRVEGGSPTSDPPDPGASSRFAEVDELTRVLAAEISDHGQVEFHPDDVPLDCSSGIDEPPSRWEWVISASISVGSRSEGDSIVADAMGELERLKGAPPRVLELSGGGIYVTANLGHRGIYVVSFRDMPGTEGSVGFVGSTGCIDRDPEEWHRFSNRLP